MPIGNPFKVLGLGTRKFQRDNAPLQSCEEMLIEDCEYGSPTDACCKVAPCKFCLIWTPDDGTEVYGTAIWTGSIWTGTAGGIVWTGTVGKVDGVCTFTVTLAGTEVWSLALCGSGAASPCGSLDGSVAYGSGYSAGTFTWRKKIVHELALRGPDAETKCARPFCGTCDCTCDELCVTISREGGDECTGVIPQTGTFCDGQLTAPEWSGDVACVPSGDTASVTVTLSRDQYTDDCVLSGSVGGTIDGQSVDMALDDLTVGSCDSLYGAWSVSAGSYSYTVTVSCLQCESCEPEICLECCDSVPPAPPATLVARISLAAVHNEPDEPPINTSCWENLQFNITFVYDVGDDVNQACSNQGNTRRADCIGNLLDNEFNEECCTGGQWIGSGSNSCGKISICFVPCATSLCGTPPPGETLSPWHALMSVGDAFCDEEAQCLICHDPIAFSKFGYRACSSALLEVGTGYVDIQVDISET